MMRSGCAALVLLSSAGGALAGTAPVSRASGPAALLLASAAAPGGRDGQAEPAQPETANAPDAAGPAGTPSPDESSAAPLPDPELVQHDESAPAPDQQKPSQQPEQPQPAAPWPPASENQPEGVHWFAWICALIVTLAMAGAVLVAIWVAGHRKRFAAVGEDVETRSSGPETAPPFVPQQATPQLPSAASLASADYRRRCAASLERGGWQTQTGEAEGGGPDIVAERDGRVALVRCRSASHTVTAEMVNEAVAMGAHRDGDLIILASNAPIHDRARDEAAQHGVYLLRDTELAGFVL